MFRECRQKRRESVDDYAQELRCLYQRAYARAQKGNPAAEAMGKSILVYQFVSGLLPELNAKVAGAEPDSEKSNEFGVVVAVTVVQANQ